MALAAFGNAYIQNNAPWKAIKSDRAVAEGIIKDCLQIVKALALLMEPVIPEEADAIWNMLGNPDRVQDHILTEALVPIGPGPLPEPGPIFTKPDDTKIAELDAVLQGRVAKARAKKAGEKSMDQVTIEEFGRMDLRTGRVLKVDPVKGAKKLYRMDVDVGGEIRQIVSGIAPFYAPEELVGKDVVVIMNLKPAKIFGLESRGMLLAAGEQASLLVPFKDVPPGTRIC
jgi:methionyl-tRNA synthetase